jgi:regulator of protease activity HflC (stomatin/prohibitin superfamily)
MELTYVAIIAALIIVILYNTIKILQEYERGVVFFLGRFQKVKGPGLIILIPGIQKMIKVDLRVMVLDVPTQDVISKDNVSVHVNAVIYFRIVDPEKAIIRVANAYEATSQLSQTTLRSVLGQHELDEMLSEREKLSDDIQAILDQRTDNWGIKVANVEIKHVDLDESMIRAIAQQAEAERSRRAKVINAEGEKQAASMIAEAANILASEEQGLQVRYLQTLKEIANERTNTIVFPMPLELVEPILRLTSAAKDASRQDT